MNEHETISLTRTTDLAFGEPGQMVTIPRQVGSVRLERQIGQGAMGVVWLGTDELLQRRVAVKFLLTAVQGPDDPRLAAFLEGARAAAALRHSNLTNILHAATVENVPFLVMEFVDGPSLSAIIRESDPLSVHELLAVMSDACNAIGHLHDLQRVHRDIKPSNILIDREGTAFVTDFGLSRELSARPGVLREGGASIAGTPAYMAPEMFEGQISGKSDVYALGVTAFESLAGQTPFPGTLDEVRERHASQAPPIERLLDRGIPPALVEAIERALNKSPLFRHKSPAHFLAAIEAACGGPALLARGRQALFDRLLRIHSAASTAPAHGSDPALPAAPPHTPGATYYDRLTVIAEQKRKEASDFEVRAAAERIAAPTPRVPAPQPIDPVLFGPQEREYPIWPLISGLILCGTGALQAVIGPIAMIGFVARPIGSGPFRSARDTTEPGQLWTTLGWTGIALGFFFGVALIVLGIGFMVQRPWSARLARSWGYAKLALAVGVAALAFAASRQAAPGENAAVAALAALAIEAVIPLILLGWLSMRESKAQIARWK